MERSVNVPCVVDEWSALEEAEQLQALADLDDPRRTWGGRVTVTRTRKEANMAEAKQYKQFSSWYRTADGTGIVNLAAATAIFTKTSDNAQQIVAHVRDGAEYILFRGDNGQAEHALRKLAAQLNAHFKLEVLDAPTEAGGA